MSHNPGSVTLPGEVVRPEDVASLSGLRGGDRELPIFKWDMEVSECFLHT